MCFNGLAPSNGFRLQKIITVGKFDPFLHVRLHSHLDSMTSMMLAGPKNNREVVLKHVFEVVGRIKTLWERSMMIFEKSLFEDFSTPKKNRIRKF